jgi:hypothetical protein
MIGRLLLGCLLGLLIGGVVAAGLVAGLGVQSFGGDGGMLLGYLAAALTGVLTGLVAGKPIWSRGGKIEAGLKAFFGALLGSGVLFALHRWAGAWPIDIPALGLTSHTPIAELPTASLPLLAAVLGGFFELDNTGGGGEEAAPAARGAEGAGGKRPAAGARKVRVGSDGAGAPTDAADDDEAEAAPKRAKR